MKADKVYLTLSENLGYDKEACLWRPASVYKRDVIHWSEPAAGYLLDSVCKEVYKK